MAKSQRTTSKRTRVHTTWLKNAAKSMGLNALEVVKSETPVISTMATSIIDNSRQVVESVRKNRYNMDSVGRMIQQNSYFRLAVTGLQNGLEDLKSGNFNNTEREQKAMNASFGLGGNTSSNDAGSMFGDFDSDDSGSQDVNISVDTSGTSAALAEVSNRQAEAVYKSAEATINANLANTSAMMLQSQEHNAKVLDSLDNIGNQLSAIVSFNNDTMSQYITTSMAYMEKMGASLEQLSKSSNAKVTSRDTLLGSNGGLNIENYMQLVKQQAKEFLDNNMIGMMNDTIQQYGDMMIANPLGMATQMLMEQAIPEVVKNATAQLDQTVGAASTIFLQKLYNDWGNNYGSSIMDMGKRFIGQAFGLKNEKTKYMNLGGKMTGASVAFDDYTHHSINEIIPKYLRESTSYLKSIAEAVTGNSSKAMLQGSEAFDYQTGTYRTLKDIREEVYGDLRNQVASTMRDTAFGKSMIKVGKNAAGVDTEKYNEALNNLLYELASREETPDFSQGREAWMDEISDIITKMKTDDTTAQYLKAAVEATWSNRSGGATMTPGILAGTSARNKAIKNMQDNATAYHLYDLNDANREVDDAVAEVIYGRLPESQVERRVSERGALMDVLDNMNFLLERGINVRTTGTKAYKKTDGNRRNKYVPFVGNVTGNGTGRKKDKSQNENKPSENQTNDATPENINPEDIQNEVNSVLQQENTETLRGLAGSYVNRTKNVVSGIYDILEGDRKGGLAKLKSAVSLGPRRPYLGDNQVYQNENGEYVDKNGNVVRTDANGKPIDENGNELEIKKQSLVKRAIDRLNKVANMKPEEAKNSFFNYILGDKEDTGKVDEHGNAILKRKGSKNAVVRTAMTALSNTVGDIYTGVFGEAYDPDKKQSFTGKLSKTLQNQVSKYKDFAKTKDGQRTMKLLSSGGAGGLIGAAFGGPIGGIIGSGIGMVTQSNTVRNFIFGEESDVLDENGNATGQKKRQGGIIDKFTSLWHEYDQKYGYTSQVDENGKIIPGSKKVMSKAMGLGAGALLGMFTPMGPVGGAVAGLASSLVFGRGRLNTFLFGDKDGDTGKGEIGLFARLKNTMKTLILEPLKTGAKHFLEDSKDFLKDAFLAPIEDALEPVTLMFHNMAVDTKDFFARKFGAIIDKVSGHLDTILGGVQGLLDNAQKMIGGAFKTITGGVFNFFKNHNPIRAIGRFADKRNKKRSVRKVTEELRGRAFDSAGRIVDVDAYNKYTKLLDGDAEAVKEAEAVYGGGDYDAKLKERDEKRAIAEGEKNARRAEEQRLYNRKKFILRMTKGRLVDDTDENFEEAVQIFNQQRDKKKLKNFGSISGFKANFDVDSLRNPESKDATPADAEETTTSEDTGNEAQQQTAENTDRTARNTDQIVSTLDQLMDLLKEQKEKRYELAQQLNVESNERVENGGEYFDPESETQKEYNKINNQIEGTERRIKIARNRRSIPRRIIKGALASPITVPSKILGTGLKILGHGASGAIYSLSGQRSFDRYSANVYGEHNLRETLGDKYDEIVSMVEDEAKLQKEQPAIYQQNIGSRWQEHVKDIEDQYGTVGRGLYQALISKQRGDRYGVQISDLYDEKGNLKQYAKGTDAAPGGWSIVGENGPEMRYLNKGDQIKPNDQMIKVSIEGIGDKLYDFLDKHPIGTKIIGSRGLIPVYLGGMLSPRTDAKTNIIGSMDDDENVDPGHVVKDISDGIFGVGSAAGGAAGKSEEDSAGFLDTFMNTEGGFFDKLKAALGNLKIVKTAKDLITKGSKIGKNIAGAATVAIPATAAVYLAQQSQSNANGELYDIDENGNVIVDENGQAQSHDDTNEKLSFKDRLLNTLMPQKTVVDHETGEVSNIRTTEETGKNNMSTFRKVNMAVRAGQMFANKGLPWLTSKAGQLGTRFASSKGGAFVMKAGGKLGTKAASLGKTALKGGLNAVKNAAGLAKNNAIVQRAANSSFTQRVIALVKNAFSFISTKFMDLCKRMGWDKIANTVQNFAKKVIPGLTDDVVKKNTSLFTKLTEKVSAAASSAMLTELIGFGIGGISGASNPSNLFDCDFQNDNLDTVTKGAMIAISTLFRGFQGTTAGMVMDVLSVVWSGITGESMDICKNLANTMLEGVIGLGKNGAKRKENLKNAQADFKSEYNDYIQEEYNAYKQHLIDQGKENEVMSFEDYMGSIGTSFEDYNNKRNRSILRKGWDGIKSIFTGKEYGISSPSDAKVSTTTTVSAPTQKSSYLTGPSTTTTGSTPKSTTKSTSPMSSYLTGGSGGDVPYYSQNDPRWKNADYSAKGGETFGQAGCGPTAMAMAASGASGMNINPMQMASFAQKNGFRDNSGTNQAFIDSSSNALGLSSTSERNPDMSFMDNQLSKGKPVVLLGRDGGYGGASAFTKAGHYVVATGKTKNGDILVNDPRGKQFSGAYDPKRLLGESAKAWAIGGRGTIVNTDGKLAPTVTNTNKKTGSGVTAEDVITVAKNEIGYVEKASNTGLESKTANPGKNNYTKYGAWIGANGDFWCAAFACWCFYMAANQNRDVAKSVLGGVISARCQTLYDNFSKQQRLIPASSEPKPGDLIFFQNKTVGQTNHIGIVVSVENGKINTIEGNTSASKEVDGDGGKVAAKSYKVGHEKILGFARPFYDNESNFQGISASESDMDASIDTNSDGTSTEETEDSGNWFSNLWNKINTSNVVSSIQNYFKTGSFETQDATTDTASASADSTSSGTIDPKAQEALSSGAYVGSDGAETTYKFLRLKGYSPAATAGIMGNLQQESGIKPTAKQNPGLGRGIAQWSEGGRWNKVLAKAQELGKSEWDIQPQLEVLDEELNGGDPTTKSKLTKNFGGLENFKKTSDIKWAADAFEQSFERAGKPKMEKRYKYAEDFYNKYANSNLANNTIGVDNPNLSSGNTISGTGGFGDFTPYDEDQMDMMNEYGGFGPQTNAPKVESVGSKTVTKIINTSTSGSQVQNNDQLLKAIIEILGTIADNTGTTSTKLDGLKSLGNATYNYNEGSKIITGSQTSSQKSYGTNQIDQMNRIKVQKIAKG